MRFGILSKQSIATFRKLARTIEYDDGIGPTELYGAYSRASGFSF